VGCAEQGSQQRRRLRRRCQANFSPTSKSRRTGHFVGPPSNQQLSRYFHLDDTDRKLVNVRRGAHNKLGFALQLSTVRFLGTFLAEPTAVPSNVVAYVAAQLGIRDVARLADYVARPTTGWEHTAEIRRVYGYRDFSERSQGVCWRRPSDTG
jgi:TnpA family transposase